MAPLDPFEEYWMKEEAEAAMMPPPPIPSTSVPPPPSLEVPPRLFSSDDSEGDEDDDEEEEEDEENTEVQIDDADSKQRLKEEEMARMQIILSTFTEAQMKRYEAIRRSGFSKVKMNRLLNTIFEKDVTRVVGKDESKDVNIVVSALAKLFTGDLIETARVIMTERKDTGPMRPCHLRESYRWLKLEGKTFKPKIVPRVFY